jgi:hypothetical protein
VRGTGVVSAVYATRGDLYRYGLPRGNLGAPARECGSVDVASNAIELDGHGFEDGDAVVFRSADDANSLPSPLVAGTTYYAKRVNYTRFSVTEKRGLPVINITTAGGVFFVATELPFEEQLELYSRWVDDFLPAHAAPLTCPYPPQVVATVAELAAKKLMQLAGHKSESVDEAELAAKAKLERWAKGLTVRNATRAQHTNLSVTSRQTDGAGSL